MDAQNSCQDGYEKRLIYKSLWFSRVKAISVACCKGLEKHNNAVDAVFYDAINLRLVVEIRQFRSQGKTLPGWIAPE